MTTTLIKAKLGEQYLIGYDPYGVLYASSVKRDKVAASVVAEYINVAGTMRELLLAWHQRDCTIPTRIIMSTSLVESRNPKRTTVLDNWTDFDRGYWLPDTWILEAVNGNSVVVANVLQEKPCITCKRQNYLNERVCWNCGNHPFR